MNKKKWHRIWILIALPAVLLLFHNQLTNWHYHVTGQGIMVEHAHPFTNNMIPGTPFQNHQHSEFEYLVLAQLMQSIVLIVLILLLLGQLFLSQTRHTPLPLPLSMTGPEPGQSHPRAPPGVVD
ncbi:MAG: hypothetical protein ACLFN2_02060 [Bacteroidales bacterium]